MPILKTRFLGLLAFISVLFMILFTAGSVPQEEASKPTHKSPVKLIHSVKGPDLFYSYCASCHGSDAKGSGPVAPALVSKVPDLTTIAERSGGIFPEQRVRKIIAGDEIFMSHGSREMPVWGPIFHQVEEDQDLGEVRLQNLTKYLESIQRK